MIKTFFNTHSYSEDEYIIIFFPHAGGSSHFYREAFLKTSSIIPCVFYDKPGSGDRFDKVFVSTFEELILDIQEFIKPFLTKKIILMGNSMGALIAYKLAEILEKMGKNINLLIVTSMESPKDFEMKVNQEPEWENFDSWLKHVEEVNEIKFEDIHHDIFKFFKSTLNNDFNILKSFKAEKVKISAPIWAFTGNQDYSISSQSVHLWQEYTSNLFHFHSFLGNHFFLIDNIEIILKSIINHLNSENYY